MVLIPEMAIDIMSLSLATAMFHSTMVLIPDMSTLSPDTSVSLPIQYYAPEKFQPILWLKYLKVSLSILSH